MRSHLGNKLFFDFKLVDKTNQNLILAQSKISLNNIINSNKSAYDIIKKFNPDVFLDGTINYQDQGKDKKEFILKDLSDNKLIFKSEDAIQTDQGLELKKPLKLQSKPSNPEKEISTSLYTGAIYLVFDAKNISDGNWINLLADRKGKGLVIKVQNSNNNIPKTKEIVENGTYLYEIRAGKDSIKVDSYFFPTKYPKRVKRLNFKINPKDTLPNFFTLEWFHLDWYQIGPGEQNKKPQQNAKKEPTIILKTLAIFNDKSFAEKGSLTKRSELINGLIRNYVKK